ncbi:GNAT family N-acetyltransferase [Nocardioides currus]|uniref:GNAT family N-acetyltransferase n=1 Tax=Nocardioides currus TaxID=2133958 RepID=A0A2R7YVQ6_9ACTN|nr:GNAT family N-acetyltransferase [Nocardioides currus]PUA80394.1 GNAT family N-acetyltransferase [Nocardioides currus]
MPDLIEPDVRVRESFLESVEEFLAEGRGGENTMLGLWREKFADRWESEDGFADFVAYLHADATPDAPRPDHHVPQSTWWLVEGDRYLGRISCRHALNDWLAEYGGHVGYEIRASARRRGHATWMLRSVLPHVHALGIDPALLTCDDTNVASRKVIEAAGGVFEDQRAQKLRFWVPTDVETAAAAPSQE